MPIDVTIQREDADHTQAVSGFKFPTTPDRLWGKLDQLGFTPENIEQFSIVGIDYSHGEYTAEIENHFPESVSLIAVDKLNYLAALIDGLCNEDELKLFTLFDYAANVDDFPYECDSLDDMIDLAGNLEQFIFILDVQDVYDLSGVFLDQRPLTQAASKQMAEGMFDSVEYAKEVMDNEWGSFVDWGYMAWNGKFEPTFIDNGVPDAHRVWEDAISDMLPVKFDVQMPDIDYNAINKGCVDITALITAHEIVELAAGGQDPELFGGEWQKAAQIIEMAHLLEIDPAFFPEWLHDSVLSKLGADVAALINRQMQIHKEEGVNAQIEYEIDPSAIQKYGGLLHKLLTDYPAQLRGDTMFQALLVARELHRQRIETMSPMVDRSFLEDAGEAQLKAFHLLPSDKQVMMECAYETVSLYNSLVLDNSRKMADTYDSHINRYVALHKLTDHAAPRKESILEKLKQAKEATNSRPQQPQQTDKKKPFER